MADKGFLSKLFRKFQKLPSYDDVICGWEQTEDFKARYDKLVANPEYNALPYTEDMAVRLDISYRYLLFWYAIHDREAEFIRRLADAIKRGRHVPRGLHRTVEAFGPCDACLYFDFPFFAEIHGLCGQWGVGCAAL